MVPCFVVLKMALWSVASLFFRSLRSTGVSLDDVCVRPRSMIVCVALIVCLLSRVVVAMADDHLEALVSSLPHASAQEASRLSVHVCVPACAHA